MFYFNSFLWLEEIQLSKGIESNQTEPSTPKLDEFHCYSDTIQPCQFLLSSKQCLSSPLLWKKHFCKHSWWYTHFSMPQHLKPAFEPVKSQSQEKKAEVWIALPKRWVKPETAHQLCTAPTQKQQRTAPLSSADSFTVGTTIKTTNWMTLRCSPRREVS